MRRRRDRRSCLMRGSKFMAVISDAELEIAEATGRKLLESEPRASAVRYDRKSGRVSVELANGCIYGFPAKLVQDLHRSSHDDLERVEVDGAGFNLHWPTLGVDLYVPALVARTFGTRAWMAREFARMAGRSTSAAKAAAARANGAKGGRPRKASDNRESTRTRSGQKSRSRS